MLKDWHTIAEQVQPTLTENREPADTEWLAELLPDLFSSAEFRGGLSAFE